jgi:TrkA domain protein
LSLENCSAGRDAGSVDVTETLLPGVGIRYEFVTAGGEHVGLVARRSGQFELVRYDRGDPDAADSVVTLTQGEADVLAELLGAPRIAERFADLTREIPGLLAAQVEVPVGSRFAGRTLGETRARTLTGASVVAVVSGQQVVASPSPDQVLQAGDVLVVVGTDQGLAGVRRLLDTPSG